MKLLIITDNNVWGGSEVLWHQLTHRPNLDCTVWSPHGLGWLPAGLKTINPQPSWLDRLRKHNPSVQLSKPFNYDAVLYVMCFFSESLAALLVEQTRRMIRRGIPLTVLVQAASELPQYMLSGKIRAQLAAQADRMQWVFVSRANAAAVYSQVPEIQSQHIVYNLPFRVLEPQPAALNGPWACVGRLHCESKGVDQLIKAFTGFPVTLDLFGDGPDEAELRRQAEITGSNVRFCGRTTDINAVWRTHPVLVLGSRIEGTPLSLIEAGLCGRPAVVTRVGGNPEVVGAGAGVVTESNPTALRAGLEEMLSWQSEWSDMGACLRQRCLELVAQDPLGKMEKILAASVR